ncbi:MAG: phosphodiester glycosidase family protein [Spirochaetales bacterium]|nr:phosphodiester glycosidase family protein [Spirochaetales bacterium]
MKVLLRFRVFPLILAVSIISLFSCTTVSFKTESLETGNLLPPEAFFPGWKFAAEGLEVLSYSTDNPKFHISAVRIDLSLPERQIIVSRGIHPLSEGDSGKNNFISRSIEQFMRSEKLLAAINTTPFKEYRLFPGSRQTAVGMVISNGVPYSRNSKYDALLFTKDRRVGFKSPPFYLSDNVSELVGGFFIILKDGKETTLPSPRAARSLAGSSDNGKILILAAIDGPDTRTGLGATFIESAEWFLAL